jgi:hypothetical protein
LFTESTSDSYSDISDNYFTLFNVGVTTTSEETTTSTRITFTNTPRFEAVVMITSMIVFTGHRLESLSHLGRGACQSRYFQEKKKNQIV